MQNMRLPNQHPRTPNTRISNRALAWGASTLLAIGGVGAWAASSGSNHDKPHGHSGSKHEIKLDNESSNLARSLAERIRKFALTQAHVPGMLAYFERNSDFAYDDPPDPKGSTLSVAGKGMYLAVTYADAPPAGKVSLRSASTVKDVTAINIIYGGQLANQLRHTFNMVNDNDPSQFQANNDPYTNRGWHINEGYNERKTGTTVVKGIADGFDHDTSLTTMSPDSFEPDEPLTQGELGKFGQHANAIMDQIIQANRPG
jgi:hypothetical protein